MSSSISSQNLGRIFSWQMLIKHSNGKMAIYDHRAIGPCATNTNSGKWGIHLHDRKRYCRGDRKAPSPSSLLSTLLPNLKGGMDEGAPVFGVFLWLSIVRVCAQWAEHNVIFLWRPCASVDSRNSLYFCLNIRPCVRFEKVTLPQHLWWFCSQNKQNWAIV